MKLPSFETSGGRQAWAFLAILGGCATFTIFAAVGVWLLRADAGLSFWLALAAHAQILVGMTAMGWAMGRRVSASAGRDGVSIDDSKGAVIRDGDDVTISKGDE